MANNEQQSFFATTPLCMEDILASELRSFGAQSVKETVAGVSFSAPLAVAYRACLWSRSASRVLLLIAEYEARTKEELYAGALSVQWACHMDEKTTFAVDCSARGEAFRDPRYAALVVKDALCDYFREKTGSRPDVNADNPALRINARVNGESVVLSIDLSGESLHRRSYRKKATTATLKENVAASVLIRAGWERIAKEGGRFVDPMCGSGTLSIEAAMIAGDIAPGLLRERYGFFAWKGHSPGEWRTLVDEANARRGAGLARIPVIEGWDIDEWAVRAARENARACGLDGRVSFARKALDDRAAYEEPGTGLVAVDPPYGKRLESGRDVAALYENLGRSLARLFPGFTLAVLAGSVELARSTGLRAFKTNTLYNGRIKCTLACFSLGDANRFVSPSEKRARQNEHGRQMLLNRLKKNLAHLGRWAKREGITCYRIYDRDMPEYAFSADYFEGKWLHVQEFAPPPEIDPKKAEDRLLDAVDMLSEATGVTRPNVFVKKKRRQKRLVQYNRLESGGSFEKIQEGGLSFLVNFTDYLDAGIFLDQRMTRVVIRELAAGKPFLNLFGYTGTATVYAASGGAAGSVTVDTSASYLDWASRNFSLNGLDRSKHTLVREDAVMFLERDEASYGFIFCDVPTFSNTKKKDRVFAVQENHVRLIRLAMARLKPDGALLFSTNFRRFRLDYEELGDYDIKDYTARTIPEDFRRDRKVHRCYLITKQENQPRMNTDKHG